MVQETLIIIKPDAFSKGVAGRVITELENEGLKLLGCRQLKLSKDKAKEFYKEHMGKEFYEPVTDFMAANPIIVMVWSGEEAIVRSRKLIGKTDPRDAAEGTIRKKWAQNYRHNIIHGSDSPGSAEREIDFFFPAGSGICMWEKKEFKL
ncbi:MAG: nucleoside-diphosphate kinase [Elusimicrobia bacterium]|jgi:nucleoside-diphosphate kinase|nr:nucleoside-diphosphate kinase [Elusimicrobiota bacterium]